MNENKNKRVESKLVVSDTCHRCQLAPEISCQSGLQNLPLSVTFVLIGGHYRCMIRHSPIWRALVRDSIQRVVYARRAETEVNLKSLHVGRLWVKISTRFIEEVANRDM